MSPYGQIVDVVQNIVFTSGISQMTLNIDSLSSIPLPAYLQTSSNPYTPAASLNPFKGKPISGRWMVSITNNFNFDGGCKSSSVLQLDSSNPVTLTFKTQTSSPFSCSSIQSSSSSMSCSSTDSIRLTFMPSVQNVSITLMKSSLSWTKFINQQTATLSNSNFLCLVTLQGEFTGDVSNNPSLRMNVMIKNYFNDFANVANTFSVNARATSFVTTFHTICPFGDFILNIQTSSPVSATTIVSLSRVVLSITRPFNMIYDGSCSQGPSTEQLNNIYTDGHLDAFQIPPSFNNWVTISNNNYPWYCSDAYPSYFLGEGSSFISGGYHYSSGNSLTTAMWRIQTSVDVSSLSSMIKSKQVIFTISFKYKYVDSNTQAFVSLLSQAATVVDFNLNGETGSLQSVVFNATLPLQPTLNQNALQLVIKAITSSSSYAPNFAIDMISITPTVLTSLASICDSDKVTIEPFAAAGFIRDSTYGGYNYGDTCIWRINTTSSYSPSQKVGMYIFPANVAIDPRDIITFSDCSGNPDMISRDANSLFISYTGCILVSFFQNVAPSQTYSPGYFQYQYDSLPAPFIQSISPSSGLGNQIIFISGFDFTSKGGLGIQHPLSVSVLIQNSFVQSCNITSSTDSLITCFLPLGQISWGGAQVYITKGPIRSNFALYNFYVPEVLSVSPPIVTSSSPSLNLTISAFISSATTPDVAIDIYSSTNMTATTAHCIVQSTTVTTNSYTFVCKLSNALGVDGSYVIVITSNGLSSIYPANPLIGVNSIVALSAPPFLYAPVSPISGNSRTTLTVNSSFVLVDPSLVKVYINTYPCPITTSAPYPPSYILFRCVNVPQALVNSISVFPTQVNVSLIIYNSLHSTNTLSFTIVQRIVLTGIYPSIGMQGDILTVFGIRFPPSSTGFKIVVGNQNCSLVANTYNASNPSSCSVSCTLPAGIGLAQVVGYHYLEYSDPSPIPFRFLGEPLIVSISPSSGGTNGGDLVTITGSLLGTDSSQVSIRIGQLYCTNVTVVGINTILTCLTPAGFGSNKIVTLVLLNGNITSSNTTVVKFSYYPPSVLALSPTSNPKNMPLSLTVQGSNFGIPSLVNIDVTIGNGTILPQAWSCKQNGIITWYVKDGTIICSKVPYGASALTSTTFQNLKVLLILSFTDEKGNQTNATLDTGVFYYTNNSQLSSIYPSAGASDTNISISVSGNNFPNNALCVFIMNGKDGNVIQLTSILNVQITYLYGNNSTNATNNNNSSSSTINYYCNLPSISILNLQSSDYPLVANVYISSNTSLNTLNSDVTGYLSGPNGYTINFNYVEKIVIDSFCPSVAPTNQSVDVDIFGTGFNSVSTLTCKVGDYTFPLFYYSSSHIKCFVRWDYQPNTYYVSVSNDNVVFFTSPTPITFFGNPATLRILSQPPFISLNKGPLTIQPIIEIEDVAGFIHTIQPIIVIADFEPPALSTKSATVTSVDGIATFSALEFTGVPGMTYNIVFQGSSTVSGAQLVPITSSPINIPPCNELIANSVQLSNNSAACVCKAGYYKFQQSCLPCPVNTFKDKVGDDISCDSCQQYSNTNGFTGVNSSKQCLCVKEYYQEGGSTSNAQCQSCKRYEGIECPGGYSIITLPGYWRASNSSFIAYQCPVTRACLGGQNSKCAKGYTGLVCAICTPGYAHSGDRCDKCFKPGANGFVLFLLLIAVLAFLFYLVRESNKDHVSMLSVALKVILNHMQILSYVGQYNLNWPASLSALFNFGDMSTVNARSFNAQCSLQLDYYGSHLLTLMLPFIAMVFIALYFIFRRLHDKFLVKELGHLPYFDRKMFNSFIRGLLIVLYLFHPILFKEALSNLACTTIDSNRVLVADKSVSCSTRQWKIYASMSVLYILFYSFGGVALIAFFLVRNKEKFEDNLAKQDRDVHNATKRYRFLFAGYRFQCYYWELLVMTRKMIIVTIGTFLSPGYQILCAIILLFEFREVSNLKLPYKDPRIQRLEIYSITVLLATLMGSILFVDDGNYIDALIFVSIVVFLINFLYGLYALRLFYKFQREESESFKKFTDKIGSRPISTIENIKKRVSGASRRLSVSTDSSNNFSL